MGFLRHLTVIAAAAALIAPAGAADPKEKIAELQENARVAAERAMKALEGEPSEAGFATAASEFGFAQQYMQQAKGFFLAARLPGDVDGWTAGEPEVVSVGAAMMGGGTSVERTYTKGGERVKLRIIADSPMIATFSTMLTNPMFAMATSSSGMRSVVLNGERAIVEQQSSGVQYSLPKGSMLFQGEGPEAGVEALMKQVTFN
ncbi:MAG: hypothetical protein AAFR11_13800 [Pseudomonadota bacterium]